MTADSTFDVDAVYAVAVAHNALIEAEKAVIAQIDKFNDLPAAERASEKTDDMKKAVKTAKAAAIDYAKAVAISKGTDGVRYLSTHRYTDYTDIVIVDTIAKPSAKSVRVKMYAFKAADLANMGVNPKWTEYLASLFYDKIGASAKEFGYNFVKELQAVVREKITTKAGGFSVKYDELSKSKKKVVLSVLLEAILGEGVTCTSNNVRYLDECFNTRVKPNTVRSAGFSEFQEIVLDVIAQVAEGQNVKYSVRGVSMKDIEEKQSSVKTAK